MVLICINLCLRVLAYKQSLVIVFGHPGFVDKPSMLGTEARIEVDTRTLD